MQIVRVMTFIINNKMAAEKCANTRKRLRQLFIDAARYQVDFMGGDANGAMYKYFKSQKCPSILKSSFSVMLRTYIKAMNICIDDPKKMIHAQMVSSNSADTLREIEKLCNDNQDPNPWETMGNENITIDCIVGVVFSWGHSPSLAAWREEKGEDLFRETNSSNLGYPEWSVKVSEYLMMLDNHHLWLRKMDKDWHTPLLLRIRTIPTRNIRRRTEEGKEKRRAKQREKNAQRWADRYPEQPQWQQPRRSWNSGDWQSSGWNQWWSGNRY